MKKLITSLLTICLLLSTFSVFAKTKKTLFIGIDGLMWQGINQTDAAPNLKKLLETSWTSTNTLAETPTWSANGWAGLLTGVSVKKHGFFINGETLNNTNLRTYPSFFHYLKNEQPSLRTASYVSWAVINDRIVRGAAAVNIKANDVGLTVYAEQDLYIKDKGIEELQLADPAAITFLHFSDVDGRGHNSGFSLTNPAYITAISTIDGYVGELVAAVKARLTYEQEDWLIVVSTDHGGVNSGHGGSSYEEQNAFIILNNESIAPALINDLPVEKVEMHPYTITPVSFTKDVYGELPDLPELKFDATKSFTIELRVRGTAPNPTGKDPIILGNKDWIKATSKGVAIINNGYNSNRVRANFADGTSQVSLHGSIFTLDHWFHVTVVVDRETQKASLYEGGKLMESKNISTVGDLSTDYNFFLGKDVKIIPGGGYFSGNIAEVRIFTEALNEATIKEYAFKPLDTNHPNVSNLIIYNKGNDATGTSYAGSLGKPDILLKTANDAAIEWASNSKPIIGGVFTDYGNAPHLYDVAPTIFNFMDYPIRDGYHWDGKALIDFTTPITSDDDGLPDPTEDEATIENFENGNINFTLALSTFANPELEIVDNPFSDVINKSDKVLKFTRKDNNPAWAGFWGALNAKAFHNFDTNEYQFARFKILRTVEGASAKIKCQTSNIDRTSVVEIFPENAPSKINEWEELIFPIGEKGAKGQYYVLGIMPDHAADRQAETVVYIDDIKLTKTNAELPTNIDNATEASEKAFVTTTGDNVTVNYALNQSSDVTITLHELSGKMLLSQTLKNVPVGSNQCVTNIQGQGVYIVKMTYNNKFECVKFIK